MTSTTQLVQWARELAGASDARHALLAVPARDRTRQRAPVAVPLLLVSGGPGARRRGDAVGRAEPGTGACHTDPGEYQWSSARAHLDGEDPSGVLDLESWKWWTAADCVEYVKGLEVRVQRRLVPKRRAGQGARGGCG